MKNKWSLLAFLCGLFLVYSTDRAILGVLAIPIQKDLGLSDVEFGCLSSGIFWTYAVLCPFAGLAGDRFDRRRIIGLAAVGWSLMTLLAGFAGGFWTLFLLVSVAIVAPQTLYTPTANALISDCHRETRTTALSLHQAAFYTGWFVSGAAVAAVLAVCNSWRWTFFLFGGVGLVLGLVFLLLNAKPVAASASGNPGTAAAPAKPTFRETLAALVKCPTAVCVALAYVVEVFVGYGYSAWGPKFIAQKFSISPGAAGTGVMFWHYAAALAAILGSGLLTDRLVKVNPRYRLAFMIVTQFVAGPMLVLFAFGPTTASVWIACATYGFARGAYGANQFAALFDVVDARFRAGTIGFINVVAAVVGSTAPLAIGFFSQHYGTRGFELAFASTGGAYLVSIAVLLVACFITFNRDRKNG